MRQRLEQNELEQKLTYFQLIKRFLMILQIYMAIITSYQTFKLEYNKLIIESDIDLSDSSSNTFTILMILYRALPFIFTKSNCFKSIRKSIAFLIAFCFISRKREFPRNIGFFISTLYSIYCAWNFNHFSYFKHHCFNILLNILHISNRYIWLHGLTSYFQMNGL